MIYRITLSGGLKLGNYGVQRTLDKGHAGLGQLLSDEMDVLGLNAPTKGFNERARCWFTEDGWKKFGIPLKKMAEGKGYTVHIRKQKNPKKSDVVYHDSYQMAVLPCGR